MATSFILLVIIFYQFYKIESKLNYDLITSNMQNVASKISATLVYAQMSGHTLNTKKLAQDLEFKFALYNQFKEKLAGNMDEKVNTNLRIQKFEDNFVLVDSTPRGHLGVYHIAIKEDLFQNKINQLIENTIFYFVLIYSVIAIAGYYLANLFIGPIINERRRLNNFIKDTTHELNTPITAILMSTGKDAVMSPKSMQRINLSAKRISEIYKDLVYIFLQENNKKPEAQDLELDLIIKEQLEYFEAFASKKKLKVTSNIEKTKFFIDRENFIRLFNNIVSNAIKYNKVAGNIDITLKNNTLTIKDTGIGIKKELLKDIFNRYYRATSEQGGFGIGLNIAYHICKTYDIKIDVESEENKGTTFILNF